MKIISFCSAFAFIASITSAFAQPATPPGGPMPAAAPVDPTKLPGDFLPHFGKRPPGMPAGGKPPPEPGNDAPAPTLSLAIEAAQAALAACAADGYKIGVSVSDSNGQPRAMLSADGATGGHVYIAARKNLAAIAFKKPSGSITPDEAASATAKPNMAIVAGAVPLMAGDKLLGAIGASGASSLQDEKCAIAGADKVKNELK